ncbi:MAG: IS1595 family transposase [Pirellulales bacterium]
MSNISDYPKSLLEAVRYFSDPDVCHTFMVKSKWPDGKITCPKCGGQHIGEIKSRRMFQCKAKECRKQFSGKVGTIFEDSPLGLDKWFVAVWMIGNCKNGASSCELARAIGVTQKSAWHMLHRVRLAMKTKTARKVCGEVESDESFIGGKVKNMHKSKRKGKPRGGTSGKAVVHGILERGKDIRCTVVPNHTKGTIQPLVRANVRRGSDVFTDESTTYAGLDSDYFHSVINHIISYAEGRVHTNGLENFWSLLKRSIGGTYVAVDLAHLQRYVDEQVFRFNKRKGTDATRFLEIMLSVTGKRLTYAELIGHAT